MSIKSIDWLKGILLPGGLAAMESCWIYAWSLFLGIRSQSSPATISVASVSGPSDGQPLLSFFNIFALIVFGMVATKAVLKRKWSLRRARLAVVSLGLVAVLVALHSDQYGHAGLVDPAWLMALAGELSNAFSHPSAAVLAAALGVLLWWRGIAHGRDHLDFDSIEGAFRLGIVALVGFLLFAAASASDSYDRLQASIGVYVLGFFLVGLTSLSLARIEDLREQSRARGDERLAVSRHWLTTVLSVVATLLLLTLGLAQILSFDVLTKIASPILEPLGAIAWLLLYAVAIPIGLLLEVLIFLARLVLRPGTPQQPLQPPDMSFLEQLRQEGTDGRLPPEVVLAVKWAIIAIVVLVAILMLSRAVFRWLKWDGDDDVPEERESVWKGSSLTAVVLDWLRSLCRRLFRARLRAPTSTSIGSEDMPEPGLTMTIRQVYRQLLQLGHSIGLPRARFTTPYEYLPQLQTVLKPDEDLAAITEAYVRARYGPEEPSDAETDDVRARWERVLEVATAAGLEDLEQKKA